MLTHQFFPLIGGVETLLLSLGPLLSARGVRVEILTRQFPGLEPEAVVRGMPVHRKPAFGGRVVASLRYTLASLAFLVGRGPSRGLRIVHAHHLLSPTTTAVLAKLLRGPRVVVTVHGMGADLALLHAARFGRVRMRLFARLVDAFVAVSDEIADALVRDGIPRERVRRIRNGVDLDRFRPLEPAARADARRALNLAADDRAALFLGRIEHVKGLDVLLDAWPTVRKRVPRATLLVLGDGSERNALEARRVDGVRFLGILADPLPVLQAVDTFVLPSRSEGLSVALLEAMACSLPSVVTDVGASAEVVDDGVHGYVVPAKDVPRLVRALTEVLTWNTERTHEAGGAARARVEERYALANTADELLGVYQRVLTGVPVGTA